MPTSSRSLFARLARRGTSTDELPTHQIGNPARPQRPVEPEAAQVTGIGIETADTCPGSAVTHRRAVARYAGLAGAPDESGSKRREKGLARAGNARVRRGMIQLAWRFLMFQKDSALAE